MESVNDNEFLKNLLRILKGSMVSIVLTLILLVLFAILLTYTNIQETFINPVIIVITGVSILIGSSMSTLRIKKNGMINGGLVGFIYIITLYVLSSIAQTGFGFNLYSIILIIVSILMGIVGGIVGVNLK